MTATTGARRNFEGTRRTSWLALLLAIALYVVVLPVANLAAFGPIGGIVRDLEQTTGSWVGPQLVYPWMTLGLVSIALFAVGRLRGEDVGWRAGAVIPALAVLVLFWACAQASLVLLVSRSEQAVEWSPWHWGRDSSALASLLDQALGVAFLEETFFRGFLLPQVFLQASRVLRVRPALVVALLVSTTLFVLSHVPRLLVEGTPGEAMAGELLWIVPWGLILALVFLVTKNLFLCVGLHSLWNARPTLVVVPWETVKGVWWALTTVLLLAWWLGSIYRSRRVEEPFP